MREEILHYIWKFQYYNNNDLQCTNGEHILVIQPGIHNVNQGPDFIESKVRINKTIWAGNVEVHINSSDWNHHKHSIENNYSNIILHVVWNQNIEINDGNGNDLPTLELQSRVSKLLLEKYKQLLQSALFNPAKK